MSPAAIDALEEWLRARSDDQLIEELAATARDSEAADLIAGECERRGMA